jgi:hypothetical protein
VQASADALGGEAIGCPPVAPPQGQAPRTNRPGSRDKPAQQRGCYAPSNGTDPNGAGALSASHALSAQAQSAANFPNRPVTLVIPFAPGVTADLLFRGPAEIASKELGQAIVIDNKPGGSATLEPAQMAATAKPDRYTIAQLAIPIYRLPVMQKTTFDPIKDFTPIILLGAIRSASWSRRTGRTRPGGT